MEVYNLFIFISFIIEKIRISPFLFLGSRHTLLFYIVWLMFIFLVKLYPSLCFAALSCIPISGRCTRKVLIGSRPGLFNHGLHIQ